MKILFLFCFISIEHVNVKDKLEDLNYRDSNSSHTVYVLGRSQSDLMQLFISPQMLLQVVLISSLHWPKDKSSSFSLTTKQYLK